MAESTPSPFSTLLVVSACLLCLHLLTGISACASTDADGDGYSSTDDCDDANASTYPGALELCDGQDNNCDGITDSWVLWYVDRDQDGFGTGTAIQVCDGSHPAGTAASASDCDDADAAVHPGAPEGCDGKDSDCNGSMSGEALWYEDADGDGFGDPTTAGGSCEPVTAGQTVLGGDCNDQDPEVNPSRADLCDGLDNDCDTQTDEDAPRWYPDSDGDGFGAPGTAVQSCAQPAGYALSDQDCAGTDPSRHPGARDVCDGIDNDCDGAIDAGNVPPWYPDSDGDGWGNAAAPSSSCPAGAGSVPVGGDCQDSSRAVHPAAAELCDGLDNDCSGTADDVPYFVDQDGDGFGNEAQSAVCTPGARVSPARGDCNDLASNVHPGASDLSGDGVDADCGGRESADVHVGLSSLSMSSLAAALAAASTGTTLWVGPGQYLEHNLSFGGKPLRLRSTHGATATQVDARWQGRHLSFVSGETSASLLDGITFKNGWVQGAGGSMRIVNSSPTLKNLRFTGNTAVGPLGQGGALALTGSASALTALTLTENRAGVCGTLSTSGSSSSTTRRGCSLGEGGALWLETSTSTATGLIFEANTAQGSGGGVLVRGGSVQLVSSSFTQNQVEPACATYTSMQSGVESCPYSNAVQTIDCRGDALGGGLAGEDAELILRENVFEADQAKSWCGSEATSSSRGCGAINYVNNQKTRCALGRGGAISLSGGRLEATGETWRFSSAALGGALAVSQATVDVTSSLSDSSSATGLATAYNLKNITDNMGNSSGHETSVTAVQGGVGGAIYGTDSSFYLEHVALWYNSAALKGGGIWTRDSSLQATQLQLLANKTPGARITTAAQSSMDFYSQEGFTQGEGGGIALEGGSLTLDHARLEQNDALAGGGLSLAGDATVSHVLLADNVARGTVQKQSGTHSADPTVVLSLPKGGQGAGLSLKRSALTMTQSVLALNDAQDATTADGLSTADGVGGGFWMLGAAGKVVSIANSIVSHNLGTAVYAAEGPPVLTYSLLSAPPGETAHNLSTLDPTVLTGEPGFLSSSSSGEPTSFHLSTTSRCVNAGVSSQQDKDGTRSDLGLYGGALGASFDLDGDLKPDWFWPGTISQPPAGFSSSSYDADDLNASR